MEKITFQKGMGMLSMSGLNNIDEHRLEFFWEKLKHYEDKEFLAGVNKVTDEIDQFYGNENIPLLIKNAISAIKAELARWKSKNAHKKLVSKWQMEQLEEKRQLENQKKIKEIVKNIGKPVQQEKAK